MTWNETNPTALDVYERAWGIIANASEGDWQKQAPEWREWASAFNRAYLKEIERAKLAEASQP
jgi:hypothetical protein